MRKVKAYSLETNSIGFEAPYIKSANIHVCLVYIFQMEIKFYIQNSELQN